MIKPTLVFGASVNPDRYSYKAVIALINQGVPVFAVGKKEGEISGVKIKTGKPILENIHTVTVYVGPQNQQDVIEYILSLHPKRIIFNPGAENPLFLKAAALSGIEVLEACTLTMLSVGNF